MGACAGALCVQQQPKCDNLHTAQLNPPQPALPASHYAAAVICCHREQQIAHAARPGFVTFSTPGDGPARRGSGSAGFSGNSPSSTSSSAAAGGAEAAKPPPKPRLPALDSLRFFFIAYIAVGHFIAFATREPFLLRLFAQVRCAMIGAGASRAARTAVQGPTWSRMAIAAAATLPHVTHVTHTTTCSTCNTRHHM